MKENKISVIVPVYNIEKYIVKTVESIRDQTYRNLEIILVDDGSSDSSGRILDEISAQDSRIKVIHQKNGGVTSARIAGIKIATGEWIGFVDGDDFIEPDMYQRLLENALKYSAQISHCGYQMVFPSRVDYYYNTGRLVQQDKLTGLYDLLDGSFIEPGLCNKLFHKTLFHSLLHEGLIDLSIKNNEDLLMNYYLFKAASASVFEDICPYHYILRKGSAATSKVNEHKLYDPIKVQKLILDDVRNNKDLANVIYGRMAGTYINGAAMTNPGKETYIDEYIKMCRQELKKIKEPFLAGNRSKISKIRYHLCSFSPTLYRVFYKVYAKARGTDNKYEVR
ncbi:glycosyltransferase family 2 protein [Ruminococcus sp. JE7B6]|uniref:glycosyltransferase family 2 protein n=1 Tax=Ruminococcus sp. JE7B6 TaxID=3233380 RepID=UPI0038998E14